MVIKQDDLSLNERREASFRQSTIAGRSKIQIEDSTPSKSKSKTTRSLPRTQLAPRRDALARSGRVAHDDDVRDDACRDDGEAARVGTLHGDAECFLPLLQNDEECIAPWTVQVCVPPLRVGDGFHTA